MHAEYVYQSDGEEILTIQYSEFGYPLVIAPTSHILATLNITYNDKGHVTSWTHGDHTFSNVYDMKTNARTEKLLSTRATYRYLYKHNRRVS